MARCSLNLLALILSGEHFTGLYNNEHEHLLDNEKAGWERLGLIYVKEIYPLLLFAKKLDLKIKVTLPEFFVNTLTLLPKQIEIRFSQNLICLNQTTT